MENSSKKIGPYCTSRFQTVRRNSRVVEVGGIPVGGTHPISVQSMTTTPTLDVEATVQQSIALAESGCDIIRITAQNVKAAEALEHIRKQFSEAGFSRIPLVADIHFLPQAAMEAVKHVEKVRINPGNYADKKKFQVKEYSDHEYNLEMERLHEAFSPIVIRCRELGRAMRIGTNHGSLSDRIMNRYGDSPLGMCESALEFIRIAESNGFRDIILSMKASNPKVAIQAYRLMVAKMLEEDMHYPLHLGVTEAGDGDDARIKSAIGIGSLLYDGLGDTIRVSLTEDPVAELPVAHALADKAGKLWIPSGISMDSDPVDPYLFTRRNIPSESIGDSLKIGAMEPPLVIQPGPPLLAIPSPGEYADALANAQEALSATPVEGLLLTLTPELLDRLKDWRQALKGKVSFVVWNLDALEPDPATLESLKDGSLPGDVWMKTYRRRGDWVTLCLAAENLQVRMAMAVSPEKLLQMYPEDLEVGKQTVIMTLSEESLSNSSFHSLGRYRQLAELIYGLSLNNPIWIRNTVMSGIDLENVDFGSRLLEASILSGSLLCCPVPHHCHNHPLHALPYLSCFQPATS